MFSAFGWASVACIGLAASLSVGVNGAEELRVAAPSALASQFNWNGKAGVIRETPALFGIPSYQTAVSGVLYYAVPNDGCSPLNKTAMDVSALDNALAFIDRGGGCSFTTKVRYAGAAGFLSVVIGDTQNEVTIPYMADDGTSPAVTTPSVMISYADANTLRPYLAPGQPDVVVSISYSLPNPDNRVEYDLWTTSVDTASATFKHTWMNPASALGANALFTPHMYTINGVGLRCDQPNARCYNQCSNGGKYCAVDPEHDVTGGLSGRDVIQENVRQLCLNEALNQTGMPQSLWFQYVSQFDANCSSACPGVSPDPTSTVNPDCARGFSFNCSYAMMDALKLPTTLVQQCVQASGGTDAGSGSNSILDRQIQDASESGIFFIPTLTINLQPYRGSLTCPVPTDSTNCGPLGAICQGYIPGFLPQACLTTPGCDVGQVKDACGVCGGDGKVDQCGSCVSASSPAWNQACKGCDGVPNSGKVNDACGVCDGDGKFDGCGMCMSPASPSWNQACKGCDGVPNSGKVNDACGVCDGPGTRLGSCLSSGSLAAIFIFVILAAVGVGGGIWYYFRRQNRVMRDDIDSLLKQYLPLEGGTNTRSQRLVDSADDTNDI